MSNKRPKLEKTLKENIEPEIKIKLRENVEISELHPSYKEISFNIYHKDTQYLLKESTYYDELELKCGCTVDENGLKCTVVSTCLNRLTFLECQDSCGSNCQNQNMKKGLTCKFIEKIETKNKGYGIFATKDINKSQYINEYCGEVIKQSLCFERMNTDYKNDKYNYCLYIEKGIVIDAQRCGSTARFVNHSCDPNCEIQKWIYKKTYRIALYSLRDIKKGEELTFDYKFEFYNEKDIKCLCGSANCTGIFGKRKIILDLDIKTKILFIRSKKLYLIRNFYKMKNYNEVKELKKQELKEFLPKWIETIELIDPRIYTLPPLPSSLNKQVERHLILIYWLNKFMRQFMATLTNLTFLKKLEKIDENIKMAQYKSLSDVKKSIMYLNDLNCDIPNIKESLDNISKIIIPRAEIEIHNLDFKINGNDIDAIAERLERRLIFKDLKRELFMENFLPPNYKFQ